MSTECRTGQVRVTQGHNLPARFIIHTVGPKYNIKYQTAAENTLHMCYRYCIKLSVFTSGDTSGCNHAHSCRFTGTCFKRPEN